MRLRGVDGAAFGFALVAAAAAPAHGQAAPPATAGQAEILTLRGSLTYRARIALTPDSRAVVAVQETGASPAAGSIGEARIELKGRQVPIAFDFSVPRSKFVEGKRYEVRGAIWSQGRPSWVGDPVPLTQVSGIVELGTLAMAPYAGGTGFATTLRCGDRDVVIDYAGTGMVLKAGGETFDMRQVETAFGTKYEAVNDTGTTFLSKGQGAVVAVRGQQYPECRVGGATNQAFRARGNEPGWSLEMDDRSMTLLTNYGKERQVIPRPPVQVMADGQRYVAEVGGKPVVVTITDRRCVDDMSGMTYPQEVAVRQDGRELKGCGGDPASLLRGGEWVVEDIDGKGIIDNSRASLNFGADDRVFGRASCNTYSGVYTLTGEGLSVAGVATTRMACAPSLMQQEERFLQVLQGVQRFDIDPTGALILHAAPGRTITARR